MNGVVIQGTPIGVDIFKVRDFPSVKVFFLTHAHSDHMVGLRETWRSGPIYMSPVTARIVRHKNMAANTFIKELEVGQSHSIHAEKSTKLANFESFTVTLIDANHCPGSVMFLFQGKFGTILHTGDFRYHPSMLSNETLNECSRIDRLYLDNTYCDENCAFGTREEVTKEIIQLIEERPKSQVRIGVTKLGKEQLLIDIAKHFQVPIVVNSERFHLYEAMGCIPNVFTKDKSESRFRVVDERKLFYVCHMSEDKLLIRPTALYFNTGKKLHKNIIVMPYSDHSSYTELKEFVSFLKPASIIPIVLYKKPEYTLELNLCHRSDMSIFNKYLCVNKSFPPRSDDPLFGVMSLPCKRDNSSSNGNQMPYFAEPIKRKKRSPSTVSLQHRVISGGVTFTDESSSSKEMSEVRFCDTSSSGSSLSTQMFSTIVNACCKIEVRCETKDAEADVSKEQERGPSYELNDVETNVKHWLNTSNGDTKDFERNLTVKQELYPGHALDFQRTVHDVPEISTDGNGNLPNDQQLCSRDSMERMDPVKLNFSATATVDSEGTEEDIPVTNSGCTSLAGQKTCSPTTVEVMSVEKESVVEIGVNSDVSKAGVNRDVSKAGVNRDVSKAGVNSSSKRCLTENGADVNIGNKDRLKSRARRRQIRLEQRWESLRPFIPKTWPNQ